MIDTVTPRPGAGVGHGVGHVVLLEQVAGQRLGQVADLGQETAHRIGARPPNWSSPSALGIDDQPTSAPPDLDVPEGFPYPVKRRLLGQPLTNDQLKHERLPKFLALGVLAPDCTASAVFRIKAGSTWEFCASKLSPGPYRFVGIALIKLHPYWLL